MSKTKWLVRVAMSVAILIGGQMVLTAVSGVEIVTVVLLSLCFVYGIRTGLAIATTFSLLRCFFFGFQVNVIVLYLVYYNLFALFFGWLGGRFAGNMSLLKRAIVVASAVAFTAMFTMLDNVITPLIHGFGQHAATVYFMQSLTALVPQCVCAFVTVTVLFEPLRKLLARL